MEDQRESLAPAPHLPGYLWAFRSRRWSRSYSPGQAVKLKVPRRSRPQLTQWLGSSKASCRSSNRVSYVRSFPLRRIRVGLELRAAFRLQRFLLLHRRGGHVERLSQRVAQLFRHVHDAAGLEATFLHLRGIREVV